MISFILERNKKRWTFSPNKGTSSNERPVLPRLRRGTVFCFPHVKAETIHNVPQFFSLALVWECYSGTNSFRRGDWAESRPLVCRLLMCFSFKVRNAQLWVSPLLIFQSRTSRMGPNNLHFKYAVWGGRREEGSGWGTHVYLWRIHFDIWQN